MIYEIHGRTEQGPVRARNEDHLLIGRAIQNAGATGRVLDTDDAALAGFGLPLAVADGMGGMGGGATASRLALEALAAALDEIDRDPNAASERAASLAAAMHRANAAVRRAQADDRQLASMGTTLSGVVLTATGYWVFHAGDSRVLRIRNGFLKLETRDDNLSEQLCRAGVPADQAAAAPQAEALVNWIGMDGLKPAIHAGSPLAPGDHLLICSDGLHGVVKEEALIAAVADPDQPLGPLVDRLIAEAIAADSQDNISLIVLRVHEGGSPPSEP